VIKGDLLYFVAADPDIPRFELLMSLFLRKERPHTHYHPDVVIGRPLQGGIHVRLIVT
jgi:hypothetical protein